MRKSYALFYFLLLFTFDERISLKYLMSSSLIVIVIIHLCLFSLWNTDLRPRAGPAGVVQTSCRDRCCGDGMAQWLRHERLCEPEADS